MKRYMATFVLFVGALTARVATGDAWTPGSPKPVESPESWFTGFAGLFSDLWGYLMY
jgi:hypothetical protein